MEEIKADFEEELQFQDAGITEDPFSNTTDKDLIEVEDYQDVKVTSTK